MKESRKLTKEEVHSIFNSPALIRKKKEAEKFFESTEFKNHVQKRDLTTKRKNSISKTTLSKHRFEKSRVA